MRVFLTGANGWVGSALARDLVAAGHSVVGLVRSREKGDALAATGGTPLVGALTSLDVLRRAASAADAVIHTAFGLDFARIAELGAEDAGAIEAFGEVYAGSAKPILVTGGIGVSPTGAVVDEGERPPVNPAFPRASEQTAFALAARGVHACVVRLPRSVHGVGETHGFVPMLAALARARGVSAYVGEGDNLWPSVHRLDAARLYRLALERGDRGRAYHAVAEAGVAYRHIAEAIGRQIGVPVRSLAPDEAAAHFGALAVWVAGSGPASSEWTREALGWAPEQIGLIADIDRPAYYN